MCNPALEELYAVPYVETYLDNIENFPDEIQRYLTQVYELHILYQSYISDIENLAAKHQNTTDLLLKKKNLLKAQSLLILAKEVGDEKINIIQQVQDLMESRYNQMGSTFCNLVTTKPETKNMKKETEIIETKKEEVQEKLAIHQNTISSSNAESTPTPRKRARRKHVDTEKDDVVESASTPMPRSSATIPVPKKNNTEVPKKKRKSKQKVDQDVESTSDKDMQVDPDEPTYCLCKKVSFGSMIMCDNESCPDEWFHFSCVSLTVTPKGKWYCPNCKKNKSNMTHSKKSK